VNAFDQLHPALQYHVVNSLGWSSLRPTQIEAIEPIQQGLNCLLLAPTAGGKTEAAVIPVLSRMLSESWPGASVLYVCPIKALLNNLEIRLTYYAGLLGRRVQVWHGDVSTHRKKKALGDPPDILLTTPESLEGMLISSKLERQVWFGNLRVVIVDELHAFASDDRGWHLRAVLSRLDRYASEPLQRIGLSATVGNPDEVLHWFSPTGERKVIGSSSVSTDADVTVDFVSSLENAAIVIERLHRGRKRLVFCDSRSGAERLGSELRQAGVRTFVSHASLSVDERRMAEAAFSEEKDCVIVATSTLELGIDVGDLDHVIQLDAPATVSSFLQRMGRTGRRQGSQRNCLFLTTTDQALLLALGVVEKWSQHWVEDSHAPAEPWNVVAQQALAMTLEQGQMPAKELLRMLAKAFPELAQVDLQLLLAGMVATGYLFEPSPDLVQIGPTTESEFGRAHYRDLLAVFTGAELLLAKHGNTDVGYIDPSVLSGEDEEKRILLAGKSWVVRSIDWPRRTVWLEPTGSGGKARWTGGSRTISREVAEAIRQVLERGNLGAGVLSKRARSAFDDLRDSIPLGTAGATVIAQPGGRYRMWTFEGTKANRTLARHAQAAGACGSDELGVDFRRDPRVALKELPVASLQLRKDELAAVASAVKFSAAVPGSLLERLALARLFEAGAIGALATGGRSAY